MGTFAGVQTTLPPDKSIDECGSLPAKAGIEGGVLQGEQRGMSFVFVRWIIVLCFSPPPTPPSDHTQAKSSMDSTIHSHTLLPHHLHAPATRERPSGKVLSGDRSPTNLPSHDLDNASRIQSQNSHRRSSYGTSFNNSTSSSSSYVFVVGESHLHVP